MMTGDALPDRLFEPVDLAALASGLNGGFASLTLQETMLHRVKLRAMENHVAPWHVHDVGAEVFVVLSGRFWMDFESGSVEVGAGQMLSVPAKTRHRARAEDRVTMLVADGFER